MKKKSAGFLSAFLAAFLLMASCTGAAGPATDAATNPPQTESATQTDETTEPETDPAPLPDIVLPQVDYPLTSFLYAQNNSVHWNRSFTGSPMAQILSDSNLVFTEGNNFTMGVGGLSMDNKAWDSVGFAVPLGAKPNTVTAKLAINETEKTSVANAIMAGIRCPGKGDLFIDGGVWFLFRDRQVTVFVKGENNVSLTNSLPFDCKDGFTFRAEDDGTHIKIYANDTLLGTVTVTEVSAKLADAEGNELAVFARTNIADNGYFRVMSHFASSTVSSMSVDMDDTQAYEPTKTYVALHEGLPYGFSGLWQQETATPTATVRGQIFADATALSGFFGFTCTYHEQAGTVTLTRDAATVIFTVGSDKVSINGKEYDAVAPIFTDGVPMLCAANFAGMMEMNFKEAEGTVLLYAESVSDREETEMKTYTDRFALYQNTVYNHDDVTCDQTGVGKYNKAEESDRLVGMAYSTWHLPSRQWGSGTWDIPLLGAYTSDNRDVIYQHGIWLRDAGVDFVFVDWSNNTDYNPETMWQSRPDFRIIEQATDLLFEVWATIPGAPKICIFVGPGHNGPGSVESGAHQAKVDQVWRDYVEKYPDQYFMFDDKPLLICYGATPNQYGATPKWNDNRFTVRWMTGFVGQQGQLFNRRTLVSSHFWSWEERGAQTFTVDKAGTVEAITCVASWRAQGEKGDADYIAAGERAQGDTLKQQFQRANDLGARLVLIVSWNEWTNGEQYSYEVSKDIEPSQTDGTFYLDLLREQIRKYKGKF